MAKKIKEQAKERIYIIPLRRACLKAPRHKRAKKAIKAIKEFIAKHMRVPERELKKVKIDSFLNEEIWFKGIRKPPAKIKVKAVKDSDNDIIKVSLAEIPQIIKYKIARKEKLEKEAEKKKEEKKAEKKKEAKKKEEAKSEEKKKTEEKEEIEETREEEEIEEKKEAVEEAGEKVAESQARMQKHVSKAKNVRVQRKAMRK